MQTKSKYRIIIVISVIPAIFSIAIDKYLFWSFLVLMAISLLMYPGIEKVGRTGMVEYMKTIYSISAIGIITALVVLWR